MVSNWYSTGLMGLRFQNKLKSGCFWNFPPIQFLSLYGGIFWKNLSDGLDCCCLQDGDGFSGKLNQDLRDTFWRFRPSKSLIIWFFEKFSGIIICKRKEDTKWQKIYIQLSTFRLHLTLDLLLITNFRQSPIKSQQNLALLFWNSRKIFPTAFPSRKPDPWQRVFLIL